MNKCLNKVSFKWLFLLSTLFAICGFAIANVIDLSVDERQLISKKRVGRSFFNYTYTVTASNGGADKQNVVATVTSLSPNTVIVEDTLTFGAIPASSSVQSIDTFTFRQNRRVLFNPENLVYTFSYDLPSNSLPLADAGADQSTFIGDTVILDASGSNDADGDPLTFLWSLTTTPLGSGAMLSDPLLINPTLFIDLPGDYVANLVVNDGQENSIADTMLISTENTPPVANAGVDQSVFVGEIASLDGSGSSDIDGDALTFAWLLTDIPDGSSALLVDSTGIMPSFNIDVSGSYTAELIVNDSLIDSIADAVTITTKNSAPVADAGLDQAPVVGGTVTLDGSLSSDADDDALSFNWSLTNIPTNSSAFLLDPTTQNPSFVIDEPGEYVGQLIVNDSLLDSQPDTVTITTENTKPIANAGSDQTVFVGNAVNLDGSLSNDADGDNLNYFWSITTKPLGSTAILSAPGVLTPDFTADIVGMYVVQLTVNDSHVDSDPDTVVISTQNRAPLAVVTVSANNVPVNTLIQLSGANSSDPDGDVISYQWSLTVPVGSNAILSASDVVNPSFTVDKPGVYEATLGVNDSELDSAPAKVSVTAIDINNPPDLIPVGNRIITSNQVFETHLFAIDPDINDTLVFSLVTAPTGMSIVSATGVLSWTPDISDLGTHNIEVKVTDSGGLSDTETFSIEVIQALADPSQNKPPQLEAIADQSLIVGGTLNLTAEGSDPDTDDVISYSLPLAPFGMSINASTAEISWIPGLDQISRHDVNVKIIDSEGALDIESFIVTVVAVNVAPVANDDIYSAHSGEILQIASSGVLQNDNDLNGNTALTASIVNQPKFGDVVLNQDGGFSYQSNTQGTLIKENINLTLEMLPKINVSSTLSAIYVPERAIDGDLQTSWFTARPDPLAPNGFIELSFGSDVLVKEIRLFGNRQFSSGFDFLSGKFEFFDLDGNKIYDSGDVIFSDNGGVEPNRDLVLPVNPAISNVYRVRFTSSAIENSNGEAGLAEFQVWGDGTPVILEPNLEWSWLTSTTEPSKVYINAPVTICNLDGQGAAEVIVPTYGTRLTEAVIRAFKGDTGEEIFTHIDHHVFSTNQIACGDIDADGLPELIASRNDGTLLALEHDGTLKWISEDYGIGHRYTAPSLTDLDGDGVPEIIIASNTKVFVFNADGEIVWSKAGGTGKPNSGGLPYASDIDLDGEPEIIGGNTLYNIDGDIIWQNTNIPDGPTAVGNFDEDAFAEIVLVKSGVYLLEHDGSLKWGPIALPGGGLGGAPTVADFDGDGEVEIGVAGKLEYTVFNADGSVLWSVKINDASSNITGSTVFDFENDGIAEVVYRDQVNLLIFRGTDGAVLFKEPMGSGTWIEYPVVADVDGDGRAEIIVGANNHFSNNLPTEGLRVYGAENWVTARPVWNEYNYHITNVLIDGTIPTIEQPNWLTPGLNSFRQNQFLPSEVANNRDQFTYKANDGTLDSNTATVYIDLLPINTAPQFTSAALKKATTGFEYFYGAQAIDQETDPIAFTLVNGPTGLSVEPITGLVRWSPGSADIGSHDVTLKVTDDKDFSSLQNYSVIVGLPLIVPDVIGETLPAASAKITNVTLAVGQTTEQFHPLIPKGLVIEQMPIAGALAQMGGRVALVLSKGNEIAPNNSDNLPPIAVEDSYQATAGVLLTVPAPGVMQNDSDPEGDTLSALLIDPPSKGTLNFRADGSFDYLYQPISPAPLAIIDSFTYKVNDGSADSNITTVNLTTFPPMSSPKIVSEPIVFGTEGVFYQYVAFAVDPDIGDTLSYMLTVFPVGMTIDSASGVIQWSPDAGDLGDHQVRVIAKDSDGLTDIQVFTIKVAAPTTVPDVISKTTANAIADIQAVNLITDQLIDVFDKTVPVGNVVNQAPVAGTQVANGSKVILFISKGPGPLDNDDDGDGESENEGDCDDSNNTIRTGATDTSGDNIDQNCDGVDGDIGNATIVIKPASLNLLTNQIATISAYAVLPDKTSINISALGAWSSANAAVASIPQHFVFAAGAGQTQISIEHFGLSASIPVNVTARDLSDAVPPQALITTPDDNTTITAPTNIIGTASDSNFFKYTLEMSLAGEDNYTEIATGNTPVIDGVLGQFDPTLLLNDLYSVRLTVLDTAGNSVVDETVYQVDGNMKVGNFSLSFTDLQIPMSGIPITVTRTYDSRDKRKDDFGIGWRLDVNTLQIRTNRVPGTGWEVVQSGGVFSSFILFPTDAHKVSLTLPGGRVEEFDMVVSPTSSIFTPFPPFANRASFVARPGTLGTLKSLDNNNLSVLGAQPGEIFLVDDISNRDYDPQRFKYTSANGTEIIINKVSGVEKVIEPNGNTLEFRADGIFHSLGKQALFERDNKGRIVKLIDPKGSEQLYRYDVNGDLIEHEDQENNVTHFSYNREHGLLSIIDPLGRVIVRNEYDEAGRLINTINSDGRKITFEHNIDSRQEVVRDYDGSVTVLEYDSNGNAIRVTDSLGGITVNTYNSEGNQLTTTNANGETIRRTFDSHGNKLTESNGLGNTTTWVYNEKNDVISITDALGRLTSLKYDVLGNVTERINALGFRDFKNVFNEQGDLDSYVDANGNISQFEYDLFGNLISQIDALGNRETFEYDSNGVVIQETERLGNKIITEVDRRGLFVSKTDSFGSKSLFIHNKAGVLTEFIDPLGNKTKMDIDSLGRIRSLEGSQGNKTERKYNFKGLLSEITDPLGQTTFYKYDLLGRRTELIFPDGGSKAAEYDRIGRVISQTDALGNTTSFEYDAAGQLLHIIDTLRNKATFEYDAGGNVTSQTDAKGNRIEFEYDALNRKIKTVLPDSSTAFSSYDNLNRVILEIDSMGNEKSFQYDDNGNLLEIIDSLLGRTIYSYDGENHLLSQTDARGSITTFTYDLLGNLTEKIYPDGTKKSISNGEAGRIESVIDQNGNQTKFQYDTNNRIRRKIFSDGLEEIYTYSQTGKLITATNKGGTIQYGYDSHDRVEMVKNPDGSLLEYTYDLEGNLITLASKLSPLASTKTISYSYDSLKRLKAVTDHDGSVILYTYDEIGNVESISYPNGIKSTFVYNSNSRLTRLAHARGLLIVASYDYKLNRVGDRIKTTHFDGSSVEYEYDALRRLTMERYINSANTVIQQLRYSYDSVGNRTKVLNLANQQIEYEYDVAGKLLLTGDEEHKYDANGNLIAKISPEYITSFLFDLENQLIAVNAGENDVEYGYGPEGDMAFKIQNSKVTNYLVDKENLTSYSQVLSEYDDRGEVISEYLYGQQLLSQRQGDMQYYYHQDGNKNVRLLTDDSGIVTNTYDYEAFGKIRSQMVNISNPYQFVGERRNDITGFSFLRARFYDPENARFISHDPLEGRLRDPMSLHRYLYASANPIYFLDPNGQETTLVQVAQVNALAAFTFTISSNLVITGGQKGALENIFEASLSAGFSAVSGAVAGKVAAPIASKYATFLISNPHLMRISLAFIRGSVETVFYIGEEGIKGTLHADFPTVVNVGGVLILNVLANTVGLDTPNANDIINKARNRLATSLLGETDALAVQVSKIDVVNVLNGGDVFAKTTSDVVQAAADQYIAPKIKKKLIQNVVDEFGKDLGMETAKINDLKGFVFDVSKQTITILIQAQAGK